MKASRPTVGAIASRRSPSASAASAAVSVRCRARHGLTWQMRSTNYKYEGVSPAGSHKPNTAVAQAFYNKAEGTKRLSTETGAGQWGSALAFASRLFDLECMIYTVRISFEQKPYRKSMMHVWGAEVVPSPSDRTQVGRRIRAENPDSTGSLGIAISEAVEDAAGRDDTKYSLGSVLNHVLMHQTIIGEEALLQMERA